LLNFNLELFGLLENINCLVLNAVVVIRSSLIVSSTSYFAFSEHFNSCAHDLTCSRFYLLVNKNKIVLSKFNLNGFKNFRQTVISLNTRFFLLLVIFSINIPLSVVNVLCECIVCCVCVACCMLHVACCVLRVVCCVLRVVCCVLRVVCCVLRVVCCVCCVLVCVVC
jgi:hypothetical protein